MALQHPYSLMAPAFLLIRLIHIYLAREKNVDFSVMVNLVLYLHGWVTSFKKTGAKLEDRARNNSKVF